MKMYDRYRPFLLLLLLAFSCRPPVSPDLKSSQKSSSSFKRLTILYTNDEHGWLFPSHEKDGSQIGGAAELFTRWRMDEGYDPASDRYLVLSGGDNWTGPAISTFFKGAPTFEVLQIMGYDLSAVGNHEFDFGLDLLRERMAACKFPFVAANVVNKGTRDLAEGFKPYAILEKGGLRIGIIGFANVNTPATTFPTNVTTLDFLPYDETLRRWVPVLQKENVDMIIGVGHVCFGEWERVASVADSLGVDLLTSGHCNEFFHKTPSGVHVIGGGKYLQSYVRLDVTFDADGDSIVTATSKMVMNQEKQTHQYSPDSSITNIISHWQKQVDKVFEEEIGYTENGVPDDWTIRNLVMDAWLSQYPTVDIAYGNYGGVRQGIDPGPITIGDVYSLLPFNNALVMTDLSGQEIVDNFKCCGGICGGLILPKGGTPLVKGKPIELNRTYRVLVTDFMYIGGDNFLFGKQDPSGYFTDVSWREPVIAYLKSLNTSPTNPLDKYIDSTVRAVR